jgi:hypothetical protein
LADALDGKDTHDYLERVEPSQKGGRKLAALILMRLGLCELSALRIAGSEPRFGMTTRVRNEIHLFFDPNLLTGHMVLVRLITFWLAYVAPSGV